LHVTVAGKDKRDIVKVRAVADALKLKHRDKIEFYFNTTLDRGSYRHLSWDAKQVSEGDGCWAVSRVCVVLWCCGGVVVCLGAIPLLPLLSYVA
jgi:hypothetical protein